MFKGILLCLSILVSLQGQAFDWKLLADLQVPSGSRFRGTVVGGLSALFKTDSHYFALSDDKGKISPPRVYKYRLEVSSVENSSTGKVDFRSTPEDIIFFKDKKGFAVGRDFMDPEGMVMLKDGSFLISSEDNAKLKPRRPPELMVFSAEGVLQRKISYPDYMLPERSGRVTKGVRSNLGPEGLTLSPSGKYVFVAIESVLLQDGDEPTFENEGYSRVLKYRIADNNDLVLEGERLYPISKGSREVGETNFLGSVVSEVKALSDTQLLLLEKSASGSELNPSIYMKLYLADFATGDDIQGKFSVQDQAFKPMEKILALDLGTLVDQFSSFKRLDNMEAMEFGPEVNGKKTLVVLSDDNFSERQRSLWMLLEMPELF